MTETLIPTADSIEAMLTEELGDEFRILGPLGWGKWGMRFRAEDLHRAERVILTALPPIDPADPAGGERYLEALRAASLLDHPHLVPLSGYGVCGPLRWFTTPPTRDERLVTRLARTGALPLPEVMRIAQQLASALDQAHRRGIAHGALSANEILIDRGGWLRVIEVGIAAGVERQAPARPLLTRPAQGSDQVEFSRIIHACFTGGDSAIPLPPGLPIEVEQALRRGRSPRPGERFRDLLDLVDAIDPSGEAPPPVSPATPPRREGVPTRGMRSSTPKSSNQRHLPGSSGAGVRSSRSQVRSCSLSPSRSRDNCSHPTTGVRRRSSPRGRRSPPPLRRLHRSCRPKRHPRRRPPGT